MAKGARPSQSHYAIEARAKALGTHQNRARSLVEWLVSGVLVGPSEWDVRNGPGAVISARLIAELVPARSCANSPVVQP